MYRYCIVCLFIPVVFACSREEKLFRKIDPANSGIHFANTISENDSINIFKNIYVFNGGGVATGDLNNDGMPDIYFTGNQVPNRLYLNRGDLRFEEITDRAGAQKKDGQWSFGVNMIDINNDGLLDIYVCNSMYEDPDRRRNLLFVNQGMDANGYPNFRELAKEYGLDHPSHSNNAQFFDYDLDGDLDLFIAVSSSIRKYENQFIKTSDNPNQPNKDVLLRNDWSDSLQHPVFADVSVESGIYIWGYSNSALIDDVNGDHRPDIYVANDFLSNDLFYINTFDTLTGKTRFVNRMPDIFKHQSYSAMGSDVADVNNDGLLDIVTTEMLPYYNKRKNLFLNANNYSYYINTEKFNYEYQFLRNTLQINRGRNPLTGFSVYSDCSFLAGIHATDWSWAPLLADFDNNGYKDLFISNGFYRDINDHDWGEFRYSLRGMDEDIVEQTKRIPQVRIPNFLYSNTGDLKFENAAVSWGVNDLSYSNGSAYADLDNDGDQELIVNNIAGEAFLYKNLSREKAEEKGLAANYVRYSLKGNASNIQAIGSQVTIYYDSGKVQTARVLSARGYLSQSELTVHFGLGKVQQIDSCVVLWPDGTQQVFSGQPVNTVHLLDHSLKGDRRHHGYKPEPVFLTEDASSLQLNFRHEEPDYCDYDVQRTLPHKLSQYTPPMAVGDLNGDGLEDLFIGGSSGQPDVIFYQQKNGRFSQRNYPEFKNDQKKREEHSSVLIFDADNDGDNDVYLTRGSYENAAFPELLTDVLLVNQGMGAFKPMPAADLKDKTYTGTVKAVDFDRDGDLDLFVGSRGKGHAYPQPGRSYLLRNDTGKKDQPVFTDVTMEWCPELQHIGMISDALWSDFDNDGQFDLILAGEWMPLTFFRNHSGKLVNITSATGIAGFTGWWNSLCGADFDNDGDIDYIAGNLGTNTFFKASEKEPLRIYGNDFDRNGVFDAFVSMYGEDSLGNRHEYLYHTRDDVTKQVVSIRKRFNTYAEYGEATVQNIFSPKEISDALKYDAIWMKSSYIENLGSGKFRLTALPDEAQYAPVFATMPYDFDNDGYEDVLMAGNDFGLEILQGHADAFQGLVLKNAGGNGFRALTLGESGFFVPGDAKALTRILLNDNSELILASQNRDSLKVISINHEPGKFIRLREDESRSEITLSDNRKMYKEFYRGHSFVSQQGRNFRMNDRMKKVVIYNFRNEVSRVIER